MPTAFDSSLIVLLFSDVSIPWVSYLLKNEFVQEASLRSDMVLLVVHFLGN